jgi:Inverse autotransporter, beta-domain
MKRRALCASFCLLLFSLEGVMHAEIPMRSSIYGLYSFGKSVGICESYGSAGVLFTPCLTSCYLGPILDASYHFFQDGTAGASIGTGFRFLGKENNYMGGFNVFYDYREGEFGGGYNQVGVGVELLANGFELRVNGYFPVNNHENKSDTVVYDDYNNSSVVTPYEVSVFREEFALLGFDGELGVYKCCNGFGGYAGVGAYYFEKQDFLDVWGVKGKLRFTYGKFILLEGQVAWDDVYETQGRGVIEIRLPLEFFCGLSTVRCCPCKSERPLFRESPIHLKKCCKYTKNY